MPKMCLRPNAVFDTFRVIDIVGTVDEMGVNPWFDRRDLQDQTTFLSGGPNGNQR